jgi:TusA-related sulfurtransferase
MSGEIRLDARGLEHPEPLERALAAMRRLGDGEYLHMLLHRCPYPLLELAEKQGFVHTEGEHEGVWHIFIAKDASLPLETLLKEARDV